ncbi:hypothetical protein P0082_10060 [Candidatus Haliotispira prima]|uniref:Uncharacterized protein n=1 Tax=Candidatus Haliotispira prima TaxID=3034016 RepID=A0ABY8MFP3_9SPIO|nr:hypothetical protein P0082_10060 [Candidatus Haliotispira prima]
MVSSVQLEMSSTLAIANIGAVIRLAGETAPTKAEAEASPGYVSLEIPAGGTRKFSISQHYTTNFADGLTPTDVLAPNTQYKLYLFFETGTIPSETTAEGATLANDMAVLSFTTAVLPPAGDAVWARSQAGEQLVGSLPEWSYSENQKGVFVVYIQLVNGFTSFALNIRNADDTVEDILGILSLGSNRPGPLYLFGFSTLGGSYPDADNYYYVISTKKTGKLSGKTFQLEIVKFSDKVEHRVPLTRYGS